jgi:small-conductance mechanosensitive channel
MVTTAQVIQWVIEPAAAIAVSGVFFEALYRLIRRVSVRAGVRPVGIRVIRDVLRLVWLGVAAALVVSVTGLASTLTVLTISGIVGLVISLALQATLTNMISGLLLLRDGAIRVGDVIEYSGVKGRIVWIALRNTWVQTDEGPIAIIGNSSLHSGPLINRTATPRFHADFGR